jgi:ELWxxDGT repeat protein
MSRPHDNARPVNERRVTIDTCVSEVVRSPTAFDYRRVLVIPVRLSRRGAVLAAALMSSLLATGVVPAGATDPAVTRLAVISTNNDTSSPGAAVAVGGSGGYFFVANDGAHGFELRHGDGSGTSALVKDINPGMTDSSPANLTALGTKLYFTADDGVHGRQLWVSDGTAAGTRILRDFGTDAGPDALVVSGSSLFFTLHGTDVYVSDGTDAGTRQVASGLGSAFGLAPWGAGGIAFVGDGAPWVSDGTAGAGTHVITTDLSTNGGFVALDGRLFFAAAGATGGTELYVSDGTAGGTARVKDIATGDDSSYPASLTVVGHELLFAADDRGDGGDIELWKSDGTGVGTAMVKDINSSGGGAQPSSLTAFDGKVYFNAVDASGATLWKSDGTSGGTVQVTDAGGDPVANPGTLTVAGAALFFGAVDAAHGHELWRTDGTAAGTALVKDIVLGDRDSFGEVMASIGGGRVMFTADDGVHGREPWISDGTSAGTTLDDVNLQGLANPTPLARLGDRQFFSAVRAGGDAQLYVTDGTTGGTALLAGPTAVSGMTVFRGKVYFVGFDSDQGGDQLWVSDGTAAGTRVVTNQHGLILQGGVGTVAAAGRYVYFVGTAGATTGAELYKTDGTAAGTGIVKDINSIGSQSSSPGSLVALGDKVLFSATDGRHGRELWASDGTDAGTVMVQDSAAGTGGVSPTGMYAFGGKVYYSADVVGRVGDQELWASDGTDAGTALIKDIRNDGGASAPSGFAAAGGKLYFLADATGDGPTVWTTDGTAGGTRTIDASIHYPGTLTAVRASHLLFAAGTTLYSYDTAAGGAPQALSTSVPFAPPAGAPIGVGADTAYFAAADDEHGMELWSTDGTAAGTALAADLNSGPTSSFPVPLGIGSAAPVFTTDSPTDGTTIARLGDVHPTPPTDGGDDTPTDTTPTDTTTTTTTTTMQTETPTTSTQPPPPPAPRTTPTPPLHATSPVVDRRPRPRALSLKITKKTSTHLTITGTLKLPAGASKRSCTGTITLTLKQSTHTLAHGTAHLTKTCTFKTTLTTKKPERTPTPRLSARFAGNSALQPTTSSPLAVRTKS